MNLSFKLKYAILFTVTMILLPLCSCHYNDRLQLNEETGDIINEDHRPFVSLSLEEEERWGNVYIIHKRTDATGSRKININNIPDDYIIYMGWLENRIIPNESFHLLPCKYYTLKKHIASCGVYNFKVCFYTDSMSRIHVVDSATLKHD